MAAFLPRHSVTGNSVFLYFDAHFKAAHEKISMETAEFKETSLAFGGSCFFFFFFMFLNEQ